MKSFDTDDHRFFVLALIRTGNHLAPLSAKFPIFKKGIHMKFVEKYARCFALLGILSISTWGMGCANDSGSGDAPEKEKSSAEEKPADAPEAGSTESSGDKAAEGE